MRGILRIVGLLTVLVMLCAATVSSGQAAVTTKTVSALSDPFIIEPSTVYWGSGSVKASAGSIATYSDDVLFYDGSGDGTSTEAALSTVNIAAGSATTSFVNWARVQVTSPSTAKYVRRKHTGVITTGSGYTLTWGPVGFEIATDKRAIVPNNVLPSHLDLGQTMLYNGFLEIANPQGNFADGWGTPTSSMTWSTTSPYQGAHSIRFDGSANASTFGPPVRWPLSLNNAFLVSLAYKDVRAGGHGMVPTVNVVFMDASKSILGTAAMLTEAGAAPSYTIDGAWHTITLINSGSAAPAGTTHIAIEIGNDTGGTSNSSDFVYFDAIYLLPQADMLRGSGIKFYDATTGQVLTPHVDSTSSLITLTGDFQVDGNFEVTGQSTFDDEADFANSVVINGGNLQFPDTSIQKTAAVVSNTPIVSTTTFSNSSAENTLYTGAIAANTLRAAETIYLRAMGRIGNAITGHTTTLRVKVAGTTVFTVSVPTQSSSNVPWSEEFTFTIRTTGAGGTGWGHLIHFMGNTPLPQTSTATTAVDTTAACDVTITEQFSGTSGSDTISIDQAYMEFIPTK